ncbi:60S ribosomal protein L7a-like [Uranotaenia lowii]|uniref:60S ribosomal protein L7a-like n=1 Tax=Uranotaenia lowii TaxID=190385 RepID=UPI00247AF28A|nr:60S ribosomal protein L7a-like [Uranotaenia lowii]
MTIFVVYLREVYRPENSIAKIQRLKDKAEAKAAGKEEPPAKKTNRLRQGANTVVKLVEQKKAQLVMIVHDADRLCAERWVFSSASSRTSSDWERWCSIKICTCVALTQVDNSDRANLSKLV